MFPPNLNKGFAVSNTSKRRPVSLKPRDHVDDETLEEFTTKPNTKTHAISLVEPEATEASTANIRCPLCPLFWNEFQKTINANFPSLSLHFEAALAVCGILGVEKEWKPVTVVFEGPPGTGKSLVLNCVLGVNSEWVYRSDKFSTASFVSQSATVKKSKLLKVDLLPRIKNKVLITPELAPIFRGKREEIEERFAILARVLDGRGLTVDGGTHGRRGYPGDYAFLWLGATTYLSKVAFDAMASVGNRIFFFDTSPPRPSMAKLAKLAMQGGSGESEEACTQALKGLLGHFFSAHVEDDKCGNLGLLPRPTLEQEEAKVIASAAWMIARLRAQKQGQPEYEYRIVENLVFLAQGRAAIEGCSVVLPEHLEIIRHIVMSSARPDLRPLVAALLRDDTETLDVGQVEGLLGCNRDTALARMKSLAGTQVCRFHKGSAPKNPSWLQLAPKATALMTGDMGK